MPDLFTLTTPGARLVWSGPRALPEPGERAHARALRGLLRLGGGGGAGDETAEASVPLRLAEETTYTVVVQSLRGQAVALAHRDPVMTARLHPADGGRLVHGQVRFGSQAGHSRFVVLVGGRPEAEVVVPVLPAKVDMARDVAPMRAEVEEAWAGLALAFLRPATLGAEARGAPSRPAWLGHLRAAVPRLERALAALALRPDEAAVRAPRALAAALVRRPDAPTRRALGRAGGEAEPLPSGQRVRSRVEAWPLRLSPDTPSNRWLAARLAEARRTLARVRREEALRQAGWPEASARTEAVRAELADLGRRLARLNALAPLAGADPARAPALPPLALRLRPDYAEAYEALRRLGLGLAFAEGLAQAVPHDLAVLYERWAALTLAQALARTLGTRLPPGLAFRADACGVGLAWRQGRAHALGLSGRGVEAELAFGPRLAPPGALLAQRPDALLTVRWPGKAPRRAVLDAKYRRDDGAAYVGRYHVPGPPEDALGTLHRYRDAIVGPGGEAGWVSEAVALYPYRPAGAEGFGASRLWTSLGRLGVGAIPLLPGETGWLNTWLEAFVQRAGEGW